MDCIFCKIVEKEIPAEIVYEDEETLAFLDIHPLTVGHTVVIPRFHAENILDLPEEKSGAIFKAVKRVTHLINTALNPDGFTTGMNHNIGQAVPHLHIHILPRFENDGGGNIHSIMSKSLPADRQAPQESVAEIAKKIRAID